MATEHTFATAINPVSWPAFDSIGSNQYESDGGSC